MKNDASTASARSGRRVHAVSSAAARITGIMNTEFPGVSAHSAVLKLNHSHRSTRSTNAASHASRPSRSSRRTTTTIASITASAAAKPPVSVQARRRRARSGWARRSWRKRWKVWRAP
ncbi:MAG TPA: hypothetical protein VGB15_02210 [Longimicrobium sp.]|jgi:hypothetical protein